MAHCVVPAAEAILDKEFKVLDKGFVRLVDYMGGDDRIVPAKHFDPRLLALFAERHQAFDEIWLRLIDPESAV